MTDDATTASTAVPAPDAPAVPQPAVAPAERADLVHALQTQRGFLRFAARGITDEQAAVRSTVSELSLGGIVKHLAYTERRWLGFARHGASAMAGPEDRAAAFAVHLGSFRMEPGDTLAGLLADYDAVAAETDALVMTLDLDTSHELPKAPWFEPGARWTVRTVLLHVLSETAQHCGHADVIREAIDGQKTMG